MNLDNFYFYNNLIYNLFRINKKELFLKFKNS